MSKSIDWHIKPFTALNAQEVYAVLKLRQDVFIIEQNCLYNDFDGKDQCALHVMGNLNGHLVAYARLFKAHAYFSDYCSFGRVVVAQSARGQGVGYLLVEQVIAYLEQHFLGEKCKISAQAHLNKFYQSFGFQQNSEPYLEDGIPHIAMIR